MHDEPITKDDIPHSPAWEQLQAQAAEHPPSAALILGSGMSDVVRNFEPYWNASFQEFSGLSGTSVVGHKGQISLGRFAGNTIVLFQGRLHYYEGHSWDAVVLPIKMLHALRIPKVVLTNAAGGIANHLNPGDLMVITDHIKWTRPQCWLWPGPGGISTDHPSPYSSELRESLLKSAEQSGIPLHQGIYASVTGPSYETKAEIRALQKWGADAVGMSTAREIAFAHDECGMACAALSLITNKACGLSHAPINHEEVLTTAALQTEKLARLLEHFFAKV